MMSVWINVDIDNQSRVTNLKLYKNDFYKTFMIFSSIWFVRKPKYGDSRLFSITKRNKQSLEKQ